MEVKLNNQTSPVRQVLSRAIQAPTAQPGEEITSFKGSYALDGALASTPDVRAEVVDRARQLVAQSSYPPKEVIDRIASLLAVELSDL
jgi:hypothetical protein